jgi:hypothetical protein
VYNSDCYTATKVRAVDPSDADYSRAQAVRAVGTHDAIGHPDPSYLEAEKVRIVRRGHSDYYSARPVRLLTFSDSGYLQARKVRILNCD